MAKTLSRQANQMGNARTADGEPMHSALAFEMVGGLNNLTYVRRSFVGMVCNPSEAPGDSLPNPFICEAGAAITAESFICQVPTVLPRDAYRFNWTMDIVHGTNGGDIHRAPVYVHEVSIDAVNVYLSPEPYRGAVVSGAWPPAYAGDGTGTEKSELYFDNTKMGSVYGVSTATGGTVICAPSVQENHFFQNGGQAMATVMPFDSRTNVASPLNKVYLIVTVTRHSTDGAALTGEQIGIGSFTWWVGYE
jgi:hypothetical protein